MRDTLLCGKPIVLSRGVNMFTRFVAHSMRLEQLSGFIENDNLAALQRDLNALAAIPPMDAIQRTIVTDEAFA